MKQFPIKVKGWNNFTIFLLPVIILELVKLIFLSFNKVSIEISGFTEWIGIIYYSLRFDCLVLLAIVFPLYTLKLISSVYRLRWMESLVKTLYILAICILTTLSLADVVYYHFNYQRLSVDELRLMFTNLGLILPVMKQFWYLMILLLLMWVIVLYLFAGAKAEPINRRSYRFIFLRWFAAGAFLFLMSWDFKSGQILTPTTSFFITTSENTPVVANSASELLYSLRNKKKESINWRFMEDSTAFQFYPVIHQYNQPKASDEKKNIVIFIMESVSAEDFEPGSRKTTMPFIDSLVGHSLYYSNFFANGFTSSSGFDAIVGGLPQMGQSDFFSLGYGYNKVDYAARLLRERGYASYFNYGVMEYGYSLVKSSKQYGLENNFGYGSSRFRKEGSKNLYGVYDHIFFPQVAEQMRNIQQPFLSLIFNVSTHYPFDQLPPDIFDSLPRFSKSNGKALYYLDAVYRNFFRSIQQQSWYKNTFFIFLSDHYSRAEDRKDNSLMGKFHIPMFIYSPDNSLQGTNTRPGQQIDIPPTVLDLAGYDQPFFAFGNTLRDSTGKRYAINRFKNTMELIDDSTLLQYDLNKKEVIGYFDHRKDPDLIRNLARPGNVEEDRQLKQLLAFLQVFSVSVTNNRMTAKAFLK